MGPGGGGPGYKILVFTQKYGTAHLIESFPDRVEVSGTVTAVHDPDAND